MFIAEVCFNVSDIARHARTEFIFSLEYEWLIRKA